MVVQTTEYLFQFGAVVADEGTQLAGAVQTKMIIDS
jgi:hypothetical protein